MPFVFIHVDFHVFTTLEVGCRLWMLCQPDLLQRSRLLRQPFQRAPECFRKGEILPTRAPLPEVISRIEQRTQALDRKQLMRFVVLIQGFEQPLGLSNQLRVRGMEGLRVVDASIMPTMLSANLNACVMMLADKASDFIRGKPGLEPIVLPR